MSAIHGIFAVGRQEAVAAQVGDIPVTGGHAGIVRLAERNAAGRVPGTLGREYEGVGDGGVLPAREMSQVALPGYAAGARRTILQPLHRPGRVWSRFHEVGPGAILKAAAHAWRRPPGASGS
jgi:hypothetical protein